ncbi:hypothetical protein AB0K12_18625 [Nonomuraea sp. NPDC049419]|uniref:hypothetical protein n=1 Tax=Nonomuraea sp. NPDC049419 TaxID=3155772 RepID=UPI003446562E
MTPSPPGSAADPAEAAGPTGPADSASGSAAAGAAPEAGEEETARDLAERVRACDGVVRLSGGSFGTVATYLPGERLVGVSVRERAVEVAIVATLGRPLPETADEVRRAVADLAGDRPVHVRVDDIVVEGT